MVLILITLVMPGLIIAYMIGCASKLGKETKNKKKNDKSECVETNKSECKDNKSDFSVHNNTNTNKSNFDKKTEKSTTKLEVQSQKPSEQTSKHGDIKGQDSNARKKKKPPSAEKLTESSMKESVRKRKITVGETADEEAADEHQNNVLRSSKEEIIEPN